MPEIIANAPAPPGYDVAKWRARLELAACYRIFDHLGWSELIYNHITVKLPGTDDHFLINPYGLHYNEVCASNLVEIDLEGRVFGNTEYGVNPAGLVIHTAIHAARPDAHCVAHTHTDAGMAVACQRGGLRNDNFYSSILHGAVAYHDFEGITVRPGEKGRLVESLGDRDFLVLRNHGLLACGRSVPAAFVNMWAFERSCEIQVAADTTGKPAIPLSDEVCAASAAALEVMAMGEDYGTLEFAAMVRQIDRVDRSWRE